MCLLQVTSHASTKLDGWGNGSRRIKSGRSAADVLLRIVDGGLCGVIFVAPYFFGGRHDMGRLLLISIIAATSTAWFARQALLPTARWPRTIAYLLLLLTAALVLFQIVPLPQEWIARLSPRTGQLLPLWSSGADGPASFGQWKTLSLMPHETTKSLAMLLSYCLLFIVVIGRIDDKIDAERLLQGIALAAVIMAAFGLLHYSTTDGRFFWFYWHPHRLATNALSGAFINRNHFADFLVLGMGPLLAWLLHAATQLMATDSQSKAVGNTKEKIVAWTLGGAAVLVATTVLLSRSRGGVLVLLVAGVVLVTAYLCRGLADSRFVYGLAGLAVVVLGLLSLHGYDQVAQRLDDFTEGSLDGVDHDGIRRKIWTANIAAFEAGWATGAGAGTHCEVCPVYLTQSFTKEYTHAENGYLQIGSENGIGGLVLLGAGILLCGTWCFTGLRQADDPDIVRLLGAAAAGLAASAMHSLVDFVWYIPACMSITIILAGCALRLAQLALPTEDRARCYRTLKRGRWIERTAVAALIGVWAIHTYIGPSMAAVYWDRYLRASVANTQLSRQQVEAIVGNQPASQTAEQVRLNDIMREELDNVLQWDPQCARAHLRLAARYIAQFDLLQQQSENAMNFGQIRDTLATAAFTSLDQQHEWLHRVFGANFDWLQRADAEARVAVTLCPLQGEAYVYLAQLSFLHRGSTAEVNAYIDQGLRVRPHNADVLFEVGRQDFIAGDTDTAVNRWKQCFDDAGSHQLKIVYLLAGRLTAAKFLEIFQPDWRTLRAVWTRFHELGKQEDTDTLLSYAANCAEHETEDETNIPQAFVWFFQAQFYADAGRTDEALKCLERAYTLGPRYYFIRHALAEGLQAAGRFAEAEPHYRWCMARRPEDKSLSNALVEISKQRLAQREQMFESAQQARIATGVVPVSVQSAPPIQPQSLPPNQPQMVGTPSLQVAGPALPAAAPK